MFSECHGSDALTLKLQNLLGIYEAENHIIVLVYVIFECVEGIHDMPKQVSMNIVTLFNVD